MHKYELNTHERKKSGSLLLVSDSDIFHCLLKVQKEEPNSLSSKSLWHETTIIIRDSQQKSAHRIEWCNQISVEVKK